MLKKTESISKSPQKLDHKKKTTGKPETDYIPAKDKSPDDLEILEGE